MRVDMDCSQKAPKGKGRYRLLNRYEGSTKCPEQEDVPSEFMALLGSIPNLERDSRTVAKECILSQYKQMPNGLWVMDGFGLWAVAGAHRLFLNAKPPWDAGTPPGRVSESLTALMKAASDLRRGLEVLPPEASYLIGNEEVWNSLNSFVRWKEPFVGIDSLISTMKGLEERGGIALAYVTSVKMRNPGAHTFTKARNADLGSDVGLFRMVLHVLESRQKDPEHLMPIARAIHSWAIGADTTDALPVNWGKAARASARKELLGGTESNRWKSPKQ